MLKEPANVIDIDWQISFLYHLKKVMTIKEQIKNVTLIFKKCNKEDPGTNPQARNLEWLMSTEFGEQYVGNGSCPSLTSKSYSGTAKVLLCLLNRYSHYQ